MLLSWHNIQYYQDLMAAMRAAISDEHFLHSRLISRLSRPEVILIRSRNRLIVAKASHLRNWLNDAAAMLGFHSVHVTAATLPETTGANLQKFVEHGFAGDMNWLVDSVKRRSQPDAMWPDARTAIVLTMNYGPDHDPMGNIRQHERGNISVYARGRDYHDVIKGKLKQLASQFSARSKANVKVFVDTAPLMEKPLAAQAGAGWQGKHTNLVSRHAGY